MSYLPLYLNSLFRTVWDGAVALHLYDEVLALLEYPVAPQGYGAGGGAEVPLQPIGGVSQDVDPRLQADRYGHLERDILTLPGIKREAHVDRMSSKCSGRTGHVPKAS